MNNRTLSLMMGAAGASSPAVYVEDVFSTFLYTGNGSTQTITNGIDLSGKGGLVWIKARNQTYGHRLVDSARSDFDSWIETNSTAAANTFTDRVNPNSDGFTLGSNSPGAEMNVNGATFASWTFRKAPGFFDVVTYTGNGVAGRTIAHSLGSVPGCIIVKRLNIPLDWAVYHRSTTASRYLLLNGTNAQITSSAEWNNTEPTASVFTVGSSGYTNNSGDTYVAYLFAHDAQLFGDGGNQSVVKCGSYTTDASGYMPEVDLGWEPQFLLYKASSTTGNWEIADTMRRWNVSLGSDGGNYNSLYPNLANAEGVGAAGPVVKSTGFGSPGNLNFGANTTFIYIAIRRGPMKTPTDATKVFSAVKYTKSSSNHFVQTNTVVDAAFISANINGSGGYYTPLGARLTGLNGLRTSEIFAEYNAGFSFDSNIGFTDGNYGSGTSVIAETFRRAPGFFDVVAYTGTGIAHGEAHNLGVAPELVIWKERSTASNWYVYQGFTTRTYGRLNLSNAFSGNTPGWFSSVTSTALNVCASSDNTDVNDSGVTYIAYLFATLTGISKVGSYTGTGTTLNIDCGFTNGARFVLIKRVNDVGDWYVWDTARGIVSGNDPYLLLNSTAAEVTNTDFIDPLSSGFQISSTAPAAINANGGSFIYLAIA
jgi:hypothetical protein